MLGECMDISLSTLGTCITHEILSALWKEYKILSRRELVPMTFNRSSDWRVTQGCFPTSAPSQVKCPSGHK